MWRIGSYTNWAKEARKILNGETSDRFMKCCDDPPIYYWQQETYIKLSDNSVLWAYNKFGNTMVVIIRKNDGFYRREPNDEEKNYFSQPSR